MNHRADFPLKIYEPPPEHPGNFAGCLVTGCLIALAIWSLAACFVP